MNIFLFRRGRSEKSRKKFLIPGLEAFFRLLNAFFGTYSWQLTLPEPFLASLGTESRKIGTSFGPIDPDRQSLNKASSQTRHFAGFLRGRIRFHSKELQLWRLSRPAGVKIAKKRMLIRIYPGLTRWRDLMGWRGPPRALYAGTNIVRLQE